MAGWKLIQSGDDLAKRLRALPTALTKSIVVEALRAGAAPMRDRIADLAPRGAIAPHLADNIGISLVKGEEAVFSVSQGAWAANEEYAVAVGPTKDYFYGLFLEFGWINHPAAMPFMRPGFDGTVTQSLEIISRLLWAAVSERGASTGGGTL